ncbi:acyl-CoA dehydrogenase family protein [Rhodopseudomonas palustris]|uniref:acyl-CoA dehydrogenase family protein n=1 Tax=Rhodopseudomonas palustris TaxID=1076 RepID=UPI002ACEB784|nr:acyl-CoA dehydrogenase family protein [Rhodopseudomonas palustris]WQG98967.1 acyl-CoA dehydrogenase family protein [Rhodopseudomonas palustris]
MSQTTSEAVADLIQRWRAIDPADRLGDPFGAMRRAGLFRIGLPGDDASLDSFSAIALAEQAIAATTGELGLATAFAGRQLIARFFIAGFADDAQRSDLLTRIAAGDCWAAVAISEPGAGAHPKHLQTAAAPQGESFVISGRKAWITNGPVADIFLVLAIVAIEDGRKRYGLFAVPRETPGLTMTPMPSLDVLAPASHCELALDQCVVLASARIGGERDAYPAMALPFRDVEDTVGTATTAGFLTWLLRAIAAQVEPSEDHAVRLGRLAGQVALIETTSRAAVLSLDDGTPPVPARLIGIRALAAGIVDEIRAHFAVARTDDRVGRALAAYDVLANVAREPRKQRQITLGQSLWSERHE